MTPISQKYQKCSSYTLIKTTRVSFAISGNQLNANSNHVLIILFNYSHVTTQYIKQYKEVQ